MLFIGVLSAFAPLLGRPMPVWLVNAGGLDVVVALLLVVASFPAPRDGRSSWKRLSRPVRGR